jgi:hypothetical protein
MNEKKPAVPTAVVAPPAPPAPPRFKSEDEDDTSEADFFFSSSTPAVATTVTFSVPSPVVIEEPDTIYERAQADREVPLSIHLEEPIESEPVAQSPRDYASDFAPVSKVEAVQEPRGAEPAASLFAEGDEENRDLDVPAFMRRHKF